MNNYSLHLPLQSRALIINEDFLRAWDELHSFCPWATIFQSKDFVLTWFQCFTSHEPTIICDWDGKSISGLWVLTESNGRFTGPGFDLAEYQVWLSTPQRQNDFVESALKEFQKTFPSKSIYMKYVPGTTPLDVFKTSSFLKHHSFFRHYIHPIMQTDKESLQLELKKKNRKEKINRLNRIGELRFSRITDFKQFELLIDEMALQSDFRKGALYNKTFFFNEPHRKDFLLRLFDLGHVHVTSLSVDNILIASNVGIMGTDIVHLQGINCHSPFYSKYSPGILHFLMLGIELSDTNIPYFDLTPGGADGYKSILANKQGDAFEWWFGPKTFAWGVKFKENLKQKVKKGLEKQTNTAFNWKEIFDAYLIWKNYLMGFKNKILNAQIPFTTYFLGSKSTCIRLNVLDILRPYHGESLTENETLSNPILRNNKISDLFFWDEKKAGIPRSSLFLDCLSRIEFGQQMFTLTQDNELFGVVWIIPIDAKRNNEEERNISGEKQYVLLCSCYELGREEELLKMLSNIHRKSVPEDFHSNCIFELADNQKKLLNYIKNKKTQFSKV
ncbi:GNAT family N-acetyltransferase [Aquiflexum gelatinilyticum]|uniref:GNAT family N-acetyltransferase n=1 Tax=Aquiflexum gelatinilyticum TaxID=2961943 RepID=A0A9X2SY01_9BACT|nr:GNAT family N-acetyltransferase [Aquiflexum gelatinilyticum]MCR9014627.1 GNAT family N-acetyltransferase [Aquiflexum gelatinilyticum]